MVKTKLAVTTLAYLAFVCNANIATAQEDMMFSMDDSFSMDDDSFGGLDSGLTENVAAPAEVANTAPVTEDTPSLEVAVETPALDAGTSSLDTELSLDAPKADAFASTEEPKLDDVASAPSTTASSDNPDMATFEEMDIFSQMQNATPTSAPATPPSEQLLGSVDSSVFREMVAIERETALLTLQANKEKLLAEIEASRAAQRQNQLNELERREQITRDRINWELEQEYEALKRQQELDPAVQKKKSKDAEEEITNLYTVVEIRGIAGDLSAVLMSDNGTTNVREGYPLKNGFKVSKVTTSFVEVRRGDEVEILRFTNNDNLKSNTTTGLSI